MRSFRVAAGRARLGSIWLKQLVDQLQGDMANSELQAVRLFEMVSKLFLSFCLILGLNAVMAANAQIESDATI